MESWRYVRSTSKSRHNGTPRFFKLLQVVLEMVSNYFKQPDRRDIQDSFKFFQRQDKDPKIFSNYWDSLKLLQKQNTSGSLVSLKLLPKQDTRDSWDTLKLLTSKTTRGIPKILSNFFKNKTKEVPEICLNYFINNTQGVPEFFHISYLRNTIQGVLEILLYKLKNKNHSVLEMVSN